MFEDIRHDISNSIQHIASISLNFLSIYLNSIYSLRLILDSE